MPRPGDAAVASPGCRGGQPVWVHTCGAQWGRGRGEQACLRPLGRQGLCWDPHVSSPVTVMEPPTALSCWPSALSTGIGARSPRRGGWRSLQVQTKHKGRGDKPLEGSARSAPARGAPTIFRRCSKRPRRTRLAEAAGLLGAAPARADGRCPGAGDVLGWGRPGQLWPKLTAGVLGLRASWGWWHLGHLHARPESSEAPSSPQVVTPGWGTQNSIPGQEGTHTAVALGRVVSWKKPKTTTHTW